ncbi:MAG: hypothetical protein D6683_12520 [Actinomyces sp.]|nr:MAG: hypothetical protein D6683_12520 [Actinomyces sp.]
MAENDTTTAPGFIDIPFPDIQVGDTGSDNGTPSPLGIPEGVLRPPPPPAETGTLVPDRAEQLAAQPRSPYLEGDEYRLFSTIAAESIAQIQAALVEGGFLRDTDIRAFGTWGVDEARAMREILTVANRTGHPWQNIVMSAVNTRRQAALGTSGGGGGGLPVTIRLSDPEDLKATFRQVAIRRTGGVFVDEATLDDMVREYQKREAEFQRSARAGGTVTDPPSPSAFAAAQIDAADPGGAAANRFAQMADVMTRLVSGGGQ